MRNTKWLLAAGLIAATTAACTTDFGLLPQHVVQQWLLPPEHRFQRVLPEHQPRLLSRLLLSNSTAYNNSYYTANRTPRRGPNGDYDRDGIPNRYDRDANGDGVPDRYQR